ncbi:MAG: HisA/HisF-related TIM barrel protein [Candidatus Vidania fulgoroideorum]
MKLIPAFDFYKKKIVRLYKGKFNKIKYYNLKIKKIIKFLIKNKLKIINIINLESSKKGKLTRKKYIIELIKKFKKRNIKTQIGGGIRNLNNIKKYKKYAYKIILGTKAIKNINFLKKAINKYKDKIILSIDVLKNKIMINGWKKKTNYKLKEFIKKINKFYKNKIIITNIDRDGTLKGINKKFIKKILKMKLINRKKIIFAGGFKNKKDYKFLKKKQINSYIVGKYIYKKINNDI